MFFVSITVSCGTLTFHREVGQFGFFADSVSSISSVTRCADHEYQLCGERRLGQDRDADGKDFHEDAGGRSNPNRGATPNATLEMMVFSECFHQGCFSNLFRSLLLPLIVISVPTTASCEQLVRAECFELPYCCVAVETYHRLSARHSSHIVVHTLHPRHICAHQKTTVANFISRHDWVFRIFAILGTLDTTSRAHACEWCQGLRATR